MLSQPKDLKSHCGNKRPLCNFSCSFQGRGIPNAQISVNGKERGETDSEGIYHLYGMKTGHYEIQAAAEHMGFEGTKVKITPNTPQLPDMVAARCVMFSVCLCVCVFKMSLWLQGG